MGNKETLAKLACTSRKQELMSTGT